MPRTNQDGKDIRLVLEWLCRRPLRDTDLAAVLDMPTSSYDRRKKADDYPSREELQQLAEHFEVSAPALLIAFGFVSTDAAILLDEKGLHQWIEQGGREEADFPTRRGRMDRVRRMLPSVNPNASGL